MFGIIFFSYSRLLIFSIEYQMLRYYVEMNYRGGNNMIGYQRFIYNETNQFKCSQPTARHILIIVHLCGFSQVRLV